MSFLKTKLKLLYYIFTWILNEKLIFISIINLIMSTVRILSNALHGPEKKTLFQSQKFTALGKYHLSSTESIAIIIIAIINTCPLETSLLQTIFSCNSYIVVDFFLFVLLNIIQRGFNKTRYLICEM